jgi:hypothetical protein
VDRAFLIPWMVGKLNTLEKIKPYETAIHVKSVIDINPPATDTINY